MMMRTFAVAALTLMLLSGGSNAWADDKQQGRSELIRKLIKQGVFYKVEVPGNLPHLWVAPRFYKLDFDAKSDFVEVVYAYYVTEDSRYDPLVLRDSRTNKRIGSFSARSGGLRLD